MELGKTILGAAIGGAIGALKRDGDPLKFALWGGGIGLVFSAFSKRNPVRTFVGADCPPGNFVDIPNHQGGPVFRCSVIDRTSYRVTAPRGALTWWKSSDEPLTIANLKAVTASSGQGAYWEEGMEFSAEPVMVGSVPMLHILEKSNLPRYIRAADATPLLALVGH